MQNFYRCFILLFFFCFITQLQAADLPPHTFQKLGVISAEELNMTHYAKDTSASAVVLYDAGRSYFVNNPGTGLNVNFDRHLIIKILKKSGYSWADFSVPLYRHKTSKELLTNLKAFTYNTEGGKMVTSKLTKESVFEEKNTTNVSSQKFTMPNVKEGSVIEISYKVQSPFFFNFPDWTFQSTIPVVWTEYTARFPEYFYYKKVSQGYEPFLINENKPVNLNLTLDGKLLSGTEFHWAMKDVPAIQKEPFMNSIRNYVSKIEFELGQITIPGELYKDYNTSWEKLTSTLLEDEDFGLHFARTGFTKEVVAPLVANQSDPEKKLLAIYNYVKNNIKYDTDDRLYPKASLRKALDNKIGSSADVNLLLVAMLKEAGLEANPVILSTRDHGLVNAASYPTVSKFNYVISHVKIGEKEYLLDATEPMTLPNMLPVRCLNGIGRLISSKDPRWIELDPIVKASKTYQSYLTIGADNSLKGKIQVSSSGYTALNHRKEILTEGEKKYIEKTSNKTDYWDIEKLSIENVTAPAEALKMNYEVNLTGQEQAANVIYLKPLQNEAEKENPFKLENRKFPVDFATPIEETYLFNYTIPEGYSVEEKPENVIINLPDNGGRFLYSINTFGSTVNVVSKVSINRTLFIADDYPILKEFFNQIVSKQAQQIVLKKAN